jgi:ABC-type antimicrobial peptide transport system permease subunit
LATLQAIGYRRWAILLSLVQESLFTQAIGLMLALLSGLLFLEGATVQFSMGTFQMVLDNNVILVAVLAAIILGTFGTLPPAARCLFMPVPKALRAG